MQVRAEAGNNTPEILIYDTISDYDSDYAGVVSAKGVIKAIKALGEISGLTVRINSQGGDVFQAFAMYNFLQNLSAYVTVIIDGLAASSAGLIAMAGDKVIMPENAMLMIHNPWGNAVGDGDDLREHAAFLDKVRDLFVNAYESKSGLSRDKILAYMDAETYFTAQEAKELGFCDEISVALDKTQAKTDIDVSGAVKAERERLRELDELMQPGREKIIAKAKYETFANARDIALELLKSDSQAQALRAYHDDALAVEGVASNYEKQKSQEVMAEKIAEKINKRRGY